MRPSALLVCGLLVALAMGASARADCSKVFIPNVGESGIVTCDTNGDGKPEIIVMSEGAYVPGASVQGLTVSGIGGATSSNYEHREQFLTVGSGGGAGTSTLLGRVGGGASAQCATNTNNLGCDNGDASAAFYTPVGAVGTGHSLRSGAIFAGAGASTFAGGAGAFVVMGPHGPQACVSTPAGLSCSPLLV